MNYNKSLTVFTPAYNRAHTIGRTYESLCRQTCKDFLWLIVDDGSSDNTRELVESWQQKDNGFEIQYIFQENQGMHGAHNTAYRNIHTELNTCIDSDDYMPDDAVEKIVTFWKEHGSDKYAGIVGLDYAEGGGLIGTEFPQGMTETTLNGYYAQGGRGDKKLVYRTDVIQKYPEYPRFEGERYFSLGYKYLLIDQDYHLLTLNEPLVIVDYQPEGSSFNMWKQYWNNPKGWMYLRKVHMRLYHSLKSQIKSNIHYISHCIRARQYREFCSTHTPFLSFLCIPFGFLLYLITRNHVRNNKAMNIK